MAISMTVIMYFLKRVCPLSRTSDGTEMFASHVWLPLRSLTLNNFSNVFSLSDEFSIEAFKCCLQGAKLALCRSRYRTPLCVLFPARITAAACYILAQQYTEGPTSLSLAARIASPAPAASLPTPPSHKSPFPESARFAIDFFKFNEVELASVAGNPYITSYERS